MILFLASLQSKSVKQTGHEISTTFCDFCIQKHCYDKSCITLIIKICCFLTNFSTFMNNNVFVRYLQGALIAPCVDIIQDKAQWGCQIL